MLRVLHLIATAALVVGEAGAAWSLHRLGELPSLAIDLADPVRWLAVTPPDDALVACLRVVAAAAAWWLLAVTLLYIATCLRTSEWHGTARRGATLARLTPRFVRGVVDRALTASIATVLVVSAAPTATPALAAPPPPVVEVVTDQTPSHLPPPGARPPAHDGPAAQLHSPRTHVVAPGEHLWSIAAGHVGERRPARLARYWWRVVTVNRERLRSGDPDLVHAGERVVLPPRTGRPVSRR